MGFCVRQRPYVQVSSQVTRARANNNVKFIIVLFSYDIADDNNDQHIACFIRTLFDGYRKSQCSN